MSVASRTTKGRVLVVEEHVLVATGVQLALSERGWHVHTTSGPTPDDIVATAERFKPRCTLVDIHLGTGLGSGIDLVGRLSAVDTDVVMLTSESRRMVLAECLEAGAAGWIAKRASLDDVDAALLDVVAGRALIGRSDRASMLNDLQEDRAARLRATAIFECLTKREALVLSELIDGLSAEEIAEAHYVSVATIRSQIHSVLTKLGVRSQLAAVATATPHRDLLPVQTKVGVDRRRSRHPRAVVAGPAFRR